VKLIVERCPSRQAPAPRKMHLMAARARQQSVGTQTQGAKRLLKNLTQDEDERSTSASSSEGECHSSGDEQPRTIALQRRTQPRAAQQPPQPAAAPSWLLALLSCARRRAPIETKHAAGPPSAPAEPTHAEEVEPAAAPPAAPTLPVGFRPPPGLLPPPGLENIVEVDDGEQGVPLPPGLGLWPEGDLPKPPQPFSVASFRRELVKIIQELGIDHNTGKAVQRIREQQVPASMHRAEFVDLLTRAMETRNGMVRRLLVAFVVGLAAGSPSAFQRASCLEGVGEFFDEVFPELGGDVKALPAIVIAELLPTLQAAFTDEDLFPLIPESIRMLPSFQPAVRRRRPRA